jgi:hypothetical protein
MERVVRAVFMIFQRPVYDSGAMVDGRRFGKGLVGKGK